MSNNLFKQNRTVIKSSDEPRVIDSNDIIAARIQKLTEILELESEPDFSQEVYGDYNDGFSEGLQAEQLDALMQDPGEMERRIDAAGEQAKAIMDQARADAESIISEANSEAASIMENAGIEAQQLKEACQNEGYQEGYNAGHSDGMQEVEAMKNDLRAKEENLIAEYNAKFEQMEADLMETLTSIYEHVLSVSLSDKSEVIFKLLDEVIHSVDGGHHFFVHVSGNDYEYVNEHKEELLKGLGSSDTVEIIEDMTLSESQCFIEADTGIYDCGLDTQLKALNKELRLLSYQPS